MRNFAFPYFSRDIAEFWRRWHISLSTWFRDYLYIPLGGSRGSNWMKIRNIFIIFLVSGFWHGANWTFVIWGLIHACCFLPLMLLNRNRNHTEIVAKGKLLPNFKEFIQIGITFFITVLAWVFFRAETVRHAIEYISGIFKSSLFAIPQILSIKMCFTLCMISIFLIIEWIQRENQHALQLSPKTPILLRWSLYLGIVFSIIFFGGVEQDFIYFQF